MQREFSRGVAVSDNISHTTHSFELLRPNSLDALHDAIAAANSAGNVLRVVGGATWLDAGRPVNATHVLSTTELAGITEYIPGDLVLTARAGTTLEEIADATGKHNQWFACDPPAASSATIGATIATGTSGPLSTGFGRVRDLVLGLTAVTGDGSPITVGGRVVKNVAGFDLVRLLTGSWGTLGVIAEVSVRLHARPQVDETVCVAMSADTLQQQFAAVRALPGTPMAMQVLSSRLASKVLGSPTAHSQLLVRLGGNAKRVAAQRASLATIGSLQEIPGTVWTSLQIAGAAPAVYFRVSDAPSRIAHRLVQLEQMLAAHDRQAQLMTSPHSGVIHVYMNDDRPVGDIVGELLANGVAVVGSVLPETDWQQLPSPMSEPIAAGIRKRFDPNGVLNRGILGDIT